MYQYFENTHHDLGHKVEVLDVTFHLVSGLKRQRRLGAVFTLDFLDPSSVPFRVIGEIEEL